jgi:hypothetical protein
LPLHGAHVDGFRLWVNLTAEDGSLIVAALRPSGGEFALHAPKLSQYATHTSVRLVDHGHSDSYVSDVFIGTAQNLSM